LLEDEDPSTLLRLSPDGEKIRAEKVSLEKL